MRVERWNSLVLAVAVSVWINSPASAALTVGGITFQDNAFADQVISTTPGSGSGSFTHQWWSGGVNTVGIELPADFALLESLVIGTNLTNFLGMNIGTSITVAFIDGIPFDGVGADIAFFDAGAQESAEVTINGLSKTYIVQDTGFNVTSDPGSVNLNVALIDLADFGVTSTAQIMITSGPLSDGDSDPAAIGAINTSTATGIGDSPFSTFTMRPPYPNPFSSTTQIQYRLQAPASVSLGVYTVSGRLVRMLVDETQVPNRNYVASWDRRDMAGRRQASGVYFFRLSVGAEVTMRRVVLLQ